MGEVLFSVLITEVQTTQNPTSRDFKATGQTHELLTGNKEKTKAAAKLGTREIKTQ